MSASASFGRKVRLTRNEAGMTQLELAELIGLSRASVANIEAGRQSVPLNDVPAYAKALKVRIGDLLPANWRMRQ